MKKQSLIDKMFYKYEYLESVEKDGEVFKKYKKVKRFGRQNKMATVILIILLAVAAYALIVVLSETFKGISSKALF